MLNFSYYHKAFARAFMLGQVGEKEKGCEGDP